MGLGDAAKIGLGIAGATLGASFLFPETFYNFTGGILGSAPAAGGNGSALGFSAFDPGGAANNYVANALGSVASGAGSASATVPSGVSAGIGSQLLDAVVSPSFLVGLLTAGANTANSLLQSKENEENREDTQAFSAEQSALDKEFSAGEREKDRQFQSAEAQKARDFAAGQQASSQAFSAGQARKARLFDAASQAASNRVAIFQNRANQQRGRQTPANVANLNSALLS